MTNWGVCQDFKGEKSMKQKTRFFEKIDTIDKSLVRRTKKTREKTHITNIRNKTIIKRIIKEHYKQLYTHKLVNLKWNGSIPWKAQTTTTHSIWNR